jgi:hypothetical protein
MTAKKTRKPTKREIKAALDVLAHEPITGAMDLMHAAGCTGFVIAGHTPAGSGFCITNKTTRFVRGMVRKAFKDDIESENEEARKAAEYDAAREDAWFEQRNVPR